MFLVEFSSVAAALMSDDELRPSPSSANSGLGTFRVGCGEDVRTSEEDIPLLQAEANVTPYTGRSGSKVTLNSTSCAPDEPVSKEEQKLESMDPYDQRLQRDASGCRIQSVDRESRPGVMKRTRRLAHDIILRFSQP